MSDGRWLFRTSWRSLRTWRPFRAGRVTYAVRRIRRGYPLGSSTPRRRFWCEVWTPSWNQGRGPYVSLGLGVVVFYRGY